MNVLFIHQNFPGQFKNLAPALVARGHQVVALTLRDLGGSEWNGVRIAPYKIIRSSTRDIHPWVADFETKVIRGEACLQAAAGLKAGGFEPDTNGYSDRPTCAHSRIPIDLIVSGISMRLFQASQIASMIAS